VAYAVKEIFYSLQGEGANTGRASVFCRFAGCNLWSGREEDRLTATCNFCDTDFVGTNGNGGGRFQRAAGLASTIAQFWPSAAGRPFAIFTGGEPLLQLDDELIAAMHNIGFEIAVETNGTLPVPVQVDWVCVSPKAGAVFVLRSGDEIKLVYPPEQLPPSQVEGLDFRLFFLQPMDGPLLERNTRLALEYCLAHPRWRLSLQTHKILGIR
jgi:7-carboxy-7-deazaguanine synthase (Cx14CxxC type)